MASGRLIGVYLQYYTDIGTLIAGRLIGVGRLIGRRLIGVRLYLETFSSTRHDQSGSALKIAQLWTES